jgi:hypothetical protein
MEDAHSMDSDLAERCRLMGLAGSSSEQGDGSEDEHESQGQKRQHEDEAIAAFRASVGGPAPWLDAFLAACREDGIDPMSVSNMAKRARTEPVNPFETKVPSVIASSDSTKIEAAFKHAVTLGANGDVNVAEKFSTISSKHLREHLETLRHGKQNNIVKMQMIVDTLPEMLAIKEAADKFKDTLEVQSKRMGGLFWQYFSKQSDGKVNMDVIRMLIKGVLNSRGEGPDAMDE